MTDNENKLIGVNIQLKGNLKSKLKRRDDGITNTKPNHTTNITIDEYVIKRQQMTLPSVELSIFFGSVAIMAQKFKWFLTFNVVESKTVTLFFVNSETFLNSTIKKVDSFVLADCKAACYSFFLVI